MAFYFRLKELNLDPAVSLSCVVDVEISSKHLPNRSLKGLDCCKVSTATNSRCKCTGRIRTKVREIKKLGIISIDIPAMRAL